MSNNKFWDIAEVEEQLTPFHCWGKNACRILLEKAINKYEITEIENQFGISCYINLKIWDRIGNEFFLMKFKVDSKRLRRVLNNCCALVKKYPVIFDITRTGEGFQTMYEFVEVAAPAQKNLEVVEKKAKKAE